MLNLILIIKNEDERNTALWIWETYQKQMYRIASKILRNPSDVDDAVMDAVRNMIANIQKFMGLRALDTLCLITIYVRNASLKIYNKNKKTAHSGDDEDFEFVDDDTDIENIVIEKEQFEAIARHLRNMPEIYSHPFILRHYYGYSVKELMQILDLTEVAVKKRLVRAKQQLLVLTGKGEKDDE
ncbi:MAG: sigma-70 family RNA polymerase sigma factor [Ruminococcaceae bacterium]|nr:sigma-70 family RNA polymerase sigma factor [Oscillospiraceae bacterium]